MRNLILGTIVGLALAACASKAEQMAEAGKEPLGSQAALRFIADTTERGTADNGSDYVIYWDPSGEMRGLATWSGGSETDRGRWSVSEDGLFCRQWQEWRDGGEGCWRLYDAGEEVVFARVSGTARDGTLKKEEIVQGNVDNI
ncbi:MAG: hypothetical protein WD100_06550 [Tistlia sp.]|uniref:hypothetical protein n=1 Tax=Tistlia sp. TaxID=3057121 RepID=UPI0034A1F97D